MENSAYRAVMIGVFLSIFVTAVSLSIFLLVGIMDYAEDAFYFGKAKTNPNLVETVTEYKQNVYKGYEILNYYYNYEKHDKYGTPGDIADEYIFQNLDVNTIELNKEYTLIYKQDNISGVPVIEVQEIN